MKSKTLICVIVVAVLMASCTVSRAGNDEFVIKNGILTEYNGPGGDITIPNSVTGIGDFAFYVPYGNESAVSVTIPNSVTSIGGGAFYGCSNLASITIPDSVTSIGDGAFLDCSSLENIIVPDSVTSIGAGAFHGCRSLVNMTIPDSVTSIGSDMFSGCSSLATLRIPAHLIAQGGYSGWVGLKEVTIPDGVTSLADRVFAECSSLASVTIPDSVTSIPARAFEGCSSLAEITLPDGLTSIGDCAFLGCENLAEIIIPDSVTSIGYGAFCHCRKLSRITIPRNITSIEDVTFDDCSSLTNISIPDGVTSIGQRAFAMCGFKNVTIPARVTSIGYQAFQNCRLRKVTIPGSVTIIGQDAFRDCYDLWRVTILNGVTCIEPGAFRDCDTLEEVTIPDSVTSIDRYAFWGCDRLEDICYGGTEEQWKQIELGENAVPPKVQIHFDAASPVSTASAEPGSVSSTEPSATPIASPEAPSVDLKVDGITADGRPIEIPESVRIETIIFAGKDGGETTGSVLTGIEIGRGAQAITAETVRRWISVPADAPANSEVEVLSPAGNPVANDAPVGTGMLVVVKAPDGSIVSSTSICVTGDVLGTGRMTLSQLVRMAAALTGKKPLTGVYAKAADFSGDGRITLTDLVSEAEMVTGQGSDAPTPEPSAAESSSEPYPYLAAREEVAEYLARVRSEAGFPAMTVSANVMDAAQAYADLHTSDVYDSLSENEQRTMEKEIIAQYLSPTTLPRIYITSAFLDSDLEDAVHDMTTYSYIKNWAQETTRLEYEYVSVGCAQYSSGTWLFVLMMTGTSA